LIGVKLSPHAVDKLSRLHLAENDVVEVVEHPDEVFINSLKARMVALSRSRRLAVIYEVRGGEAYVVTIIYSSRLESIVERRRRSGRWRRP